MSRDLFPARICLRCALFLFCRQYGGRILARSADFLHFRRSNNKKLAALRARQPELGLATGPLSFQSLTSSGAVALLTRVQVTSQWLLSTGCTSVFLHPARPSEANVGAAFKDALAVFSHRHAEI